MSNNDGKVPSLLDDSDTFNIADATNTKPFDDLKSIVHEYASEYEPVVDKILQGEDVKQFDIAKIFKVLTEVIMPYLDREGITDPKMAHVNDTLIQVGKQL